MNKVLISFKDVLDFIRDLLITILVTLCFISKFIIAHTEVPTGSMIPTINIGDHMIINYLPFYVRDPQVNDIVVFEQDGVNMVKRVIATGGDTVELMNGFVYVNGEVKNEMEYVREIGVTYPQLVQFPYVVPDKHYFVMGDNRLNSEDSRTFQAISRDKILATPIFKFRIELLK
ncbi:MAG: signal peptidase I [Epulopiscium sp. Nele67-Bin001]|nr:MAG: signal peptidase I [Epulopiscium sp. Nuni2H_MBin001]OON90856.1 MAG: signal peptidase I [Epulopiscium sp. Nele67-Bin001]